MKKTFEIEDRLNKLTDSRVNLTYSTAEGRVPVLLGFLVRAQSFNEIKHRLKSEDFKGVLSKNQIATIREVFKKIDLTGLRDLATSIVKKSKQNKVLKERFFFFSLPLWASRRIENLIRI